MGTLWTPSGEHHVDREVDDPRTAGPQAPSGGTGPREPSAQEPPGGPGTGAGPEVDMDELRRQLADAPPEVVVANHCYGLFELAAVYLSQSPPLLDQAQLAIDALGYIVEGLGTRLGEAHHTLQEALAQVRLAFVQVGEAQKAAHTAQGGATAAGNHGA